MEIGPQSTGFKTGTEEAAVEMLYSVRGPRYSSSSTGAGAAGAVGVTLVDAPSSSIDRVEASSPAF